MVITKRLRPAHDDQNQNISVSPTEAIERLWNSDGATLTKATIFKCLKVIQDAAKSTGLASGEIQTVVNIISLRRFNLTVSSKLIKLLIPEVSVPNNAARVAFFCIFDKGMPTTIKVNLIKWLSSLWQYDLLENKEEFHNLYDLLFIQLQDVNICPFVCYILHQLTQKTDVVQFRVNYLKEQLSLKAGHYPHLLCLWNYYSTFKPTVVKSIEGNAFYPRNSYWNDIFTQILRRKGLPSVGRRSKKYMENLPIRVFSNCAELREAVENAKNRMDVMEILSSPHGYLILSSPDPEMKFILNTWMFAEITNIWYSAMTKKSTGVSLKLLHRISKQLPCMMQTLTDFFCNHLDKWDGDKFGYELLCLIPFLTPCSHDDLVFILQKLHGFFISSSLEFQCAIIEQLMNLFCNWNLYWQTESEDSDILIEMYDCMRILGKCIDTLCLISIKLNPHRATPILNQVFDFSDRISKLILITDSDVLLLPSPVFISHMLFTISPHILCRMGGAFMLIRDVLNYFKLNRESCPQDFQENITYFNSCTKDIIGALCSDKAFETKPTSYLFKIKPPRKVMFGIPDPSSCFSFYRHPALMFVVNTYLNSTDSDSDIMAFKFNEDAKHNLVSHFETLTVFKPFVNFLRTNSKLFSS